MGVSALDDLIRSLKTGGEDWEAAHRRDLEVLHQPLTRYWLLAAETAKTPDIFLNWIVEDRTPGPPQRYYRIPAWMLQDHNELVLIEELDNTPEQVCVVRVS